MQGILIGPRGQTTPYFGLGHWTESCKAYLQRVHDGRQLRRLHVGPSMELLAHACQACGEGNCHVEPSRKPGGGNQAGS